MKWKVPYIDLSKQFSKLERELMPEIKRVMSHGNFILRDDVKKFEENIANYLGVKHVIGVNSGTDALYLSTNAAGLREGDEAITVAHTFVATLSSIVHRRAKPILVDINEDFNMDMEQVEKAITDKTKVIMPVHLNGRICEMDKLEEIAEKYDLKIIEDAAQSLGSMYNGRKAGSFGLTGCFSVHPMKTLGCAGDGGFISTNDDETAEQIMFLRNHGQKTKTDLEFFGYNSRLDNLQAAILNVKFKYLEEEIRRRREIASTYNEKLFDLPLILPSAPLQKTHFDTYNSYVIRTSKQQELFSHLRDDGIEAFIHISQPLYRHNKLNLRDSFLPINEQICKEILSLPISPEINDQQISQVVDSISKFFEK